MSGIKTVSVSWTMENGRWKMEELPGTEKVYTMLHTICNSLSISADMFLIFFIFIVDIQMRSSFTRDGFPGSREVYSNRIEHNDGRKR